MKHQGDIGGGEKHQTGLGVQFKNSAQPQYRVVRQDSQYTCDESWKNQQGFAADRIRESSTSKVTQNEVWRSTDSVREDDASDWLRNVELP